MKHIAFIIPGLDRIGGAERQVLLLAHGFKQRGWRVSVVCLSGQGGDVEALIADGIDVVLLKMRHGLKDPMGWLRFNRWLCKTKPDVIHAHLPHAVWLARWSRLFAPVRIVIDTIHTTATGNATRRVGYKLSNWLTDHVTAVSKAVAASWVGAGSVQSKQLIVLPNGVVVAEQRVTQEKRKAYKDLLGVGANFQWLAVGRLESVKDYPTQLKAFAALPQNSHLAIAGAGVQESELRQMTDQLGIADRVRWLGFVADLRPWLLAADGFVLSSKWEGLPLGILEAAAVGLPTVATNAPGATEAIDRSAQEWLTPVGDAIALQESMLRLMQLSDEERWKMGECAHQFVLAHYSLEVVLDRWEQLLNEQLTMNHKPRRWGNHTRVV